MGHGAVAMLLQMISTMGLECWTRSNSNQDIWCL